MRVQVVDERKEMLREPYVVRLGGWSLERYLAEAPEHLIWEYARGEVIMHSPATGEHQDLVGFLHGLTRGYCEAKAWGKVLTGPAAVRLFPDVVREPDLFVLPPAEVERAKGVPMDVRPCLVIEVISSSTRTLDLREKAEEYGLAGIDEYWAVDSQRRELWVHLLQGSRYEARQITGGKVESRSGPGFWLDAAWLFQDPLPPVAQCLREMGATP